MSKGDEIAIKIAQAIENANSACIYPRICECISKVLCELRDYVCDFQIDGHSDELGTISLQLTNLCDILSSFKQDNWLDTSLKSPVEDLITNLNEIMDTIISTLAKIDIKMTNKYDPSTDTIYNDISFLYNKLSDQSLPEINNKLEEINGYITKLGKPLLDPPQKNQTTKKSESTDDINDLDSLTSSDDSDDENMLDEVDERFDFQNVDKYRIQKSDYTQSTKPFFKNRYYSIYKGRMKLSKEKVTIMVLDKKKFSEEKFKRFINVLTALKHPNLESFVGYVESPLPHAVVTRYKGDKLTTILRRENGEEIEDEDEIENEDNDTNDDENENDNNDENENDNSGTNNDEIEIPKAEEEILLKPGYRTIIAFQIASAMSFLHSLKIAHRDLCTENITIDEDLNPRITNFATSRVMPDNKLCMTNMPGSLTTKFVAPEIGNVEGYNQEVDVFAFSGILYELLTNKRPFYDIVHPNFEDLIRRKKRPTLPADISPDLKDLIESCWKQDPSQRPIFANIVQQMLEKSISFPQDQDSEVLKQFYASKKIQNVDLKTCFNLLKKIQKEQDVYVYKEEVERIRSLLQKYQHYLQSSDYAKQEIIKDIEANIQIKNMNAALENLWSTFKQIGKNRWLSIALNTPSFEIPNDFKRFMEEIYICLKSMNFEVPKYEQDDTALMWDFRFIYPHFENIDDYFEADLRRGEIEKFMKEKNFKLTASPDEITESIKGILSNWKSFEFKPSDFEVYYNLSLGRGFTGQVFQGTQKSTGKKVAVKKIEIKQLIEKDQLKLCKREIACLIQLNNEYLIHFVGFVNEPGKCLWIVSELIEGGDLSQKKIKLTPFQKTKIAFEIAQGMEYLQSKGIIHRDLKTSNVLLDGDTRTNNIKAKICDFGFARNDSSVNMSMKIGTPHYMAPEVINGECYDFKADVFSYGMLLWELYAGEPPFQNYNKEEVMRMIKDNTPLNYPSNKRISPDLKDLIEKTTSYEPSIRPSFTDIINQMLDRKIAFSGSNPIMVKNFYKTKSLEIHPS